MVSVNNEVITKLISLLCSYPRLASRDGRDAWLLSLPAGVRNQIIRRHDDCRIDLTFIFDAIQNLQLQDGRWPILILIDYVLDEADGLTIAQELSRLRQEIHRSLEPPTGLDTAPVEEIVIGQDEKVPITFLENGLKAARSVARIMVTRTIGGRVFGTGWMIAPDLLITNHHVIKARRPTETAATQAELEQQTRDSAIWFGYDAGSYSEYRGVELIRANATLDYALIQLTQKSADDINLADWGYLKVVQCPPSLTSGARLNVIQHPGGRVKEIALRANFYIGSIANTSRFHYLSDTEGGSSGSPVFDDQWQVVGLHHAWDYYDHYYKDHPIRFDNLGLQYAAPSKFSDHLVATINEGILIHTILDDLPKPLRHQIEQAQGWT